VFDVHSSAARRDTNESAPKNSLFSQMSGLPEESFPFGPALAAPFGGSLVPLSETKSDIV
jgi:hypothetical protein